MHAIELYLRQSIFPNEKELKLNNDILALLFVYEWLRSKRNFFYCMYSIDKVH